ncbi:MAG: hypothetical protein AAF705_05895, partial [Bacteroidota bacterium]
KNSRIQLLCLYTLFSLSFGCSSDAKLDKDSKSKVIGKWEIKEAFRNGKLTESLDNLYFEFYEDGQMRTNILGASMQANYDFSNGKIKQEAGEEGVELEYLVETVTDTSLILSTVLRRYNFKFDLQRNLELE